MSIFSRLKASKSIAARAEADAYPALSAESPAVSGTDRPGVFPADDAFALVAEDRLDEAREIVRDMSPRDRALLSFTLEELSRLVSEEEDFRRTADRRTAREDTLGDM